MRWMTKPFRYRFRVRYNECDAQKVVFNAQYADYVDLATTEFLRNLGDGYGWFLNQGLDYQVVKLTLQWRASARFDDVIEARVSTVRLGNTSFVLEHDLIRVSDDLPICRSEAVYVMVSMASLEKVRISEPVRQALGRGVPGSLLDQSGKVIKTG